jgi:hypothetical protein
MRAVTSAAGRSRAPHFIDGTIAIVPEGLRRWLITALDRIASGIASRMISVARSSTWRWSFLSCRRGELAVRFTDEKKHFVSEASIYRLLKAHDLITRPAYG